MRIAYLSTFYPFRGGIAQFNADLGNGTTMRQQLRYMATNPKNPLLS